MPWKETAVFELRWEFVRKYLSGRWTMTELCTAYGISRKTGYKFVARHEAAGRAGLADLPRARHHQPHQTSRALARLVLHTRVAHPHWGGRKLRAWLAERYPGLGLPAPSTIDLLCQRHGLVAPRVRRRRVTAPPLRLQAPTAPNAVWGIDFKGWFRLGNGQRCEPLTLTDLYSRYVLCCAAQPGIVGAAVHQCCEGAFRTYGLPEAIRSDNGPPFASVGLGGLTQLSVWFLRLGIRLERIAPGHPEQNGRHERFHRTLKRETAQPPRASLPAQQRVFDRFQAEFNTERPHEALGQRPPATVYHPSPRPYPARLPDLVYPDTAQIRRVQRPGHVCWAGHRVHIGMALAGLDVGLDPCDNGTWRVLFGAAELGRLHADTGIVVPHARWARPERREGA